jgi:hypothetical protein
LQRPHLASPAHGGGIQAGLVPPCVVILLKVSPTTSVHPEEARRRRADEGSPRVNDATCPTLCRCEEARPRRNDEAILPYLGHEAER